MRLLSLNVGLPRQVRFQGELVTTGIFKKPVQGSVRLRKLNLEGDKQADLKVHGGVDKAVYAYAGEHYDYWRQELPDMSLPWGMFGENFTTEGMFEESVNIGDQFKVGTANLIATQPRMPCYKLGVKFGSMDMIKRFLASGLTGVYFKVMKEGELEQGDEIKLIKKAENSVTVKDIVRIYTIDKDDIQTIERAIKIKDLPNGWRYHFIKQLGQVGKK
ncbi:MAG TPA: MOSC domain-containing protein [Nitrososphaeraceae archaeon]|nr:MOSC domain-containing protein [Nitrososphaeraceae archaeon]